MKNVTLILLFLSAVARAQQPADSIPLKLIPPPPAVTISFPGEWPIVIPYPWPYPWPQEPFIVPYIITDWGSLVFEWIPTPCGDSYHENGQLSSRIECVDSVYHGKAIYWDETGHKTSEYTYAQGHMIKSKDYDSRGRLISLNHYDYNGAYHGVCVNYTFEYQVEPEKTVTHYDHGLYHGSKEVYYNDVLFSKEIYVNNALTDSYSYNDGVMVTHEKYIGREMDNHITESFTYHENGAVLWHQKYYLTQLTETYEYAANGQLTFVEKRDTLGNQLLHQRWDEQGKFIGEQKLENGMPVSPYLTYYDPYYKKKQLDWYKDGSWSRIKSETFIGDRLASEMYYTAEGGSNYVIDWLENGDSALYIKYGEINHLKKWDLNGKLISDYYYNNANFFAGSGFYESHDTTYHIVATPQTTNANVPIVCWTIYKGDTIRMDYIRNGSAQHTYTKPDVLASNHFVYDANKRTYVRHGVWKNYTANNLQSVFTYNVGSLEGKAVYYTVDADSSIVQAFGAFMNDQKEGEWTEYLPYKNTYNYQQGVRQGKTQWYDANGILEGVGTYLNGQLEGAVFTYYPDGTIHTETHYVQGQKTGWHKYYDEKGRLMEEGEYENGVPVKTWFRYEYLPNGNVKRTKVNHRTDRVA